MEIETLKGLLDTANRQQLFEEILKQLKEFGNSDYAKYDVFETPEGPIPVVRLSKSIETRNVKNVKVFVGAQHNEYNGLFGMIEFLKVIENQEIDIAKILENDQMLIFFPLMNPYGFSNPREDNKSGYYLKDGTNLNRYWRRTFAPEYNDLNDDHNDYPIPEHSKIVKKVLKQYWDNDNISIYILDFHETSLLRRSLGELSLNLHKESITYKFDRIYKEIIIFNILKLYNIPYHREPLFKTCSRDVNHKHIQLSIKQLEVVYEKLLDFISINRDKMPFFFCYSKSSKEYCQNLAHIVFNKLKERNTLWGIYEPSISHQHVYHGCIVLMNEATSRKNLYSMEIECHKQFFNIFEEIEKSKTDPSYYDKKLRSINISIELVVESIKEMIKHF